MNRILLAGAFCLWGLPAIAQAVVDIPISVQPFIGTGASAAPSGAAGGVLSGTYPNPGIASLTANAILTGNTTSLPNAVALTGLVLGNGASAPTGVANCASGVLIYSAGSVPSCATTLPSGLTIPSPTLSAPALGTPASGVATNLTGTAAGLTAGNVTTNANLTGPVTSSGNATTIAGPIPAGAVITGVTDGSSAAAGNVGEVQQMRANNTITTCTFSNGSQVITCTGNTIQSAGCVPATSSTCVQPIYFTTTGALPTNFVASTPYYIDPASYSGSTFKAATSVANAIAGTDITAGSAGSGTHTGINRAFLSASGTLDSGGISLPAGDWDCRGNLLLLPAGTTTVTAFQAALNLTSATLTGSTSLGNQSVENATLTTGTTQGLAIEGGQVSGNAAKTLFIVGNAGLGVSNAEFIPHIGCRRMR